MTRVNGIRRVAALFVAGRSVYEHKDCVECFDARRDALTFGGGCPVVAHPPCRCWSRLRHQVVLSPAERSFEMGLGLWAVRTVMECGGVLEQPAGSVLWELCGLPRVGDFIDPFCFTLYLHQSSYGFPTPKPTWLLVCGVPRRDCPLPELPVEVEGKPSFDELTQAERSRTTSEFADYLLSIARASWWSLASVGSLVRPRCLARSRDLAWPAEMA